MIKSNLKNRPLYYSGDSDRMNQHSRSDIIKAEKLIGKELFSAWVIPYLGHADEQSKVPVTVRQ